LDYGNQLNKSNNNIYILKLVKKAHYFLNGGDVFHVEEQSVEGPIEPVEALEVAVSGRQTRR